MARLMVSEYGFRAPAAGEYAAGLRVHFEEGYSPQEAVMQDLCDFGVCPCMS